MSEEFGKPAGEVGIDGKWGLAFCDMPYALGTGLAVMYQNLHGLLSRYEAAIRHIVESQQ